jgi:hypothetical protein
MKPFMLTAVMLVSWWFLASMPQGPNPTTLQVGPFTSSTACVNVAKSLPKAPGADMNLVYLCFSSTGQTVSVPLPSP